MQKSHSQLNYEKLSKIMNLKTKGYWRVKSIDILNRKIMRNNASSKQAVRDKRKIEKIVPKLPSFMKIEQCRNDYTMNLPKLRLTKSQPNFFLTVHTFNKSTSTNEKKILSEREQLIDKIFKHYPDEKFLYNSLPFFSILSYKNTLPRKFNEVVRECRKMAEYESYLKEQQHFSYREMKGSLGTPLPYQINNKVDNNQSNVIKNISIVTKGEIVPIKRVKHIKVIANYNGTKNKKSTDNSPKYSGETTKQDVNKITSKYNYKKNKRLNSIRDNNNLKEIK